MQISDRVKQIAPSLTLAITAKAKALKAEGKDVVSFGAGEPDFNTPSYIIEAAKVALDKGMTKYTPSSGMPILRKAIADKLLEDSGLTYASEQIVVSNGGKQALRNVFEAIINPGDEVIIPAPYWLTYPELVQLSGGRCVIVDTDPSNDFKMTPKQLRAAITPKTKAVVFNSPSNPTGTVYTKAEIIELARVIEEAGIYVVSDEIYEKLIYGEQFYSIACVSPKMQEQTIICSGMSKSYSMTGWRIGFSASPRAVAKAIDSLQSHTTSNANSIAQYASYVALTDPRGKEFLRDMVQIFDSRRRLIVDLINQTSGISVIEPRGAFYVMVDVSACFGKKSDDRVIDSAAAFCECLLERSLVAAVDGIAFGAPNFIRLSYAIGEEEIKKGISRIADFVSSLK